MRKHLLPSPARLALALALAALAACQSPPPAPPGTPPPPPPPRPSSGTPAASSLPAAADDTCQAASQARLLGTDYRTVPPAPAGKVVRVVCTTCPMTMDFNAGRLNVIYDAASGKVERLTCG